MSEKRAKKERRLYSKEVKKAAAEYARHLLLDSFKPKPRFIPKWLWQLGFGFYFKVPKGAK